MNTLSSLLQWLGNTIGANPNTLKTSNKTLVGAINEMTTMLYPVGCYFWTSNASFNPATAFGGSWEKLNEGITLVSAGNTYTIRAGVAKDGGSKDAVVVSHTHSQNAHSHGSQRGSFLASNVNIALNGTKRHLPSTGGDCYIVYSNNNGDINEYATTAAATATNNASGVSGTNANMPPYKAAYCWHRIA